MKMNFRGLQFERIGDKIYLVDFCCFAGCGDPAKKKLFDFCEVQVAGRNHAEHAGAKQFHSSETARLKYISYAETENTLEIVQSSDLVSVTTHFEAYPDCNVVRVWNTVNNLTDKPIVLEHVSSFVLYGICDKGTDGVKNMYLHRFYSSWHVECQPVRLSFYQLGLFNGNMRSMKRIVGANTGSWSTKEELPQAIIEDEEKKKFLFFQIESNNSWYYEIGDTDKLIYMNLGGPNATANQWSRRLEANGGEFSSVPVAVVTGGGINEVTAEMTKYRRHIVRKCAPDRNLPTIFNEYMHLSWDSPNEKRTAIVAPSVAELGIRYYVIDCGWHDECDVKDLYRMCGKWRPSARRFPSGLKSTIDMIHKCGMKAGVWLEPEIIGADCKEMEDYYGDECFMTRNGEKVVAGSRKFLDFRNRKVRDYLTETVDMLVRLGVNYIKFDYNQDVGAGTETDSISLGDGLTRQSEAYLCWVKSIMDKYPDLIIEACSSGGQRMDYKTLSLHPLVSTSDQTDYKKYPHIAANILSAVLPEQAAVWSYPVNSPYEINAQREESAESANARIDEEQVVTNMVNSMLGRMHLASAVHLLNERKRNLIKEGIRCFDSLSAAKKIAVPYFPLGFSDFYGDHAAAGLISKNTLYFAVWNLNGNREIGVPIPEYKVKNLRLVYPSEETEPIGADGERALYSFEEHLLKFTLPKGYTARFFAADIEKTDGEKRKNKNG